VVNETDRVILTVKGTQTAEWSQDRMLVVCAWCLLVLHWNYGQGVSHGICEACSEKLLAMYELPRKAQRELA
jgi:hypothetical protein